MSSIASLVDRATSRLREAGLAPDEARRDAGVLARSLLQWSLADWLGHAREETPEGFEQRFSALIERRCTREPVAYLLGEREFYGRVFHVTRDTLIPRPETEGLVEAALEWLDRADVEAPLVIDVGTGSGCVAISIALEAAGTRKPRIIATDIWPPALDVARDNAARLGAATVEFRLGALLGGVGGPVDLIVSNPPYVPGTSRTTLQDEVVKFEPAVALFAGDDGLDIIRALIATSREALSPGGALIIEIGAGQADTVAALIGRAGFSSVARHRDLQGIDRIIVAEQPGPSL